jgi:hypothetical protein
MIQGSWQMNSKSESSLKIGRELSHLLNIDPVIRGDGICCHI